MNKGLGFGEDWDLLISCIYLWDTLKGFRFRINQWNLVGQWEDECASSADGVHSYLKEPSWDPQGTVLHTVGSTSQLQGLSSILCTQTAGLALRGSKYKSIERATRALPSGSWGSVSANDDRDPYPFLPVRQ